MALGVEMGLGPGYIVIDWDPAPSPKRGRSPLPIFGPFLLWPNGWMHQDATRYGGRLQPCEFVLDGDLAPSLKRGRLSPILRVDVENFEIGPEVWGTSSYS